MSPYTAVFPRLDRDKHSWAISTPCPLEKKLSWEVAFSSMNSRVSSWYFLSVFFPPCSYHLLLGGKLDWYNNV